MYRSNARRFAEWTDVIDVWCGKQRPSGAVQLAELSESGEECSRVPDKDRVRRVSIGDMPWKRRAGEAAGTPVAGWTREENSHSAYAAPPA